MEMTWWFGAVCLFAAIVLVCAGRDKIGWFMLSIAVLAWSVILVGRLLA